MIHRSPYVPSHPHLFIVKSDSDKGPFNASLRAAKTFQCGEIVAFISGTRSNVKAYDTLQCGKADEHLLLDSDLRYANHSCAPNTVWDMSTVDMSRWHVRAIKRIPEGDSITFFYPSTEWEMDQPFKCSCGAQDCFGEIRGARWLTLEALRKRGLVNPGILQMIEGSERS